MDIPASRHALIEIEECLVELSVLTGQTVKANQIRSLQLDFNLKVALQKIGVNISVHD